MKKYFLCILGLLISSLIAAEAMPGTWTNKEFIYKPSLGARGATEKATFDNGLDRVDTRLAKEIWIGDPHYGTTLQAAVAAIGSSQAILRAPAGNHNFPADFSIPANITLKPERGALLIIVDGKTLTLNGGVEAGLDQIFSCTGSGKVVFAAGAVPTVYPQWWGASPTASAAVNAAAIQASFSALANNTSWTLPPGDYICNASLILGTYGTILSGLDMTFKGKLLFDTCSGLDVRGVRYSEIRGIKVARTAKDWSANNFGVKFNGLRRCNIGLDFIQNFTYGFYLDGDGSSGTGSGSDGTNSYMTFNLGYISDNQYGEYVNSINGGWVSECSHYGGQFQQSNKAGVTGDWAVYLAGPPVTYRYDNMRWYNPSFEGLHNGVYLAGYNGGTQMFLSTPRFEGVDNWIEAAPRNLTWIQGASAIERQQMTVVCPRMIDSTGKSIVNIIGSGYYDLDGYNPYAVGKEFGITWYNQYDLSQVTNLTATPQDTFCLQVTDNLVEVSGSGGGSTVQRLNKGYEAAAAPTGAGAPMTYARGAVVWNTNIASGQAMGWVCSSAGSIYRSGTISGVGNVTGTILTVTTVGSTYYLFAGAFLKINGVQHQIKNVISYDKGTGLGVYGLYANNLGGDVTGKNITESLPTWVAMPNYP